MEQVESNKQVDWELAMCFSALAVFICALCALFIAVYFCGEVNRTDSYIRAKIKIQEQVVTDMVSAEGANRSRQDEMLKALINDLDARR